jgi:hypothetical protein
MPDGMLHPSLSSDDRWHHTLAALNGHRFTPALPGPGWEAEIAETADLLVEEGRWLEGLRAKVSARAAEAPRDPDGFIQWFEQLEHNGPGQNDPLFPWLAEQATMEEMRWFLQQEVAGEAGFEDLTALTQVRLAVQPKLELARNYWDEMGRGNAKGMHGPMLEHLARRLDLKPAMETTVWESLALANTMAGLAANRRYAYQSVGALGVIEQTAPGRAKLVGIGLRRLGVSGKDRHYFDLHSILDIKHSEAWNAEAGKPLVAMNPDFAPALAEGALMRLEAGAACFARYRRELGLSIKQAA